MGFKTFEQELKKCYGIGDSVCYHKTGNYGRGGAPAANKSLGECLQNHDPLRKLL